MDRYSRWAMPYCIGEAELSNFFLLEIADLHQGRSDVMVPVFTNL